MSKEPWDIEDSKTKGTIKTTDKPTINNFFLFSGVSLAKISAKVSLTNLPAAFT